MRMLATTDPKDWVGYEQELEIYKKKSSEERDVILRDLSSLGKMKNYRVMLAKVTYVYLKPEAEDPNRDNEKKTINIADVPISLELYQKFMYKKVNVKDVTTYTLKKFLEDACNELLPQAFGDGAWLDKDIAPNVIDDAPKFKSVLVSASQLRKSVSKSRNQC